MKPGCIFKSILIAVTIIGIGYYLFDHYGTVIYERSKEKIIEKLTADITERLKKEAENKFAEELDGRISNFSDKLKEKAENVDLSEIYGLFRGIEEKIDTVVVDKITFDEVDELIDSFEEKIGNIPDL